MAKGRTPPEPKLLTFTVTSGYGGNTRRPFVQIEGPMLPTTMDSSEARALALNIYEAAITAEADGLIVEFFTKEIGTSQEEAAQILQRFRTYRKRWRNEVDAA
jgi:hypothetical protein